MPTPDDLELWVMPEEETAVSKQMSPGGLDPFNQEREQSPLTKTKVRTTDFLAKIGEVSAFLSDVVQGLKESRVRLDEITVSFEISNAGALKWVLGAGVRGGTSLKFKIDPPNPPTGVS